MTAPPLGAPSGDALARARRRATWLLVGAAALGSVANIAVWTVTAIAARELLDDTALAGASTTTLVLGSAVGTTALAWVMVRSNRRAGLVLGLLIALAGGVIGAGAIAASSFPLLLAGTVLFGFGNSATQLSRYAAADMATAERRAWAIGLVVWAGTVGAVIGPNLAPLAASAFGELGLAELAGPFLLSAAIMGTAAVMLLVWLRPDPYELADESARVDPVAGAREPMRRVLQRPRVAMAVISLVIGQVVMVSIMTMTPLHMDDHGHALGAVGLVISAHTLGMFALSPLSGRISARIGVIPAIVAAIAILAASAGVAALAPTDGPLLGVALFLLGYGWNLGFVAGSALLVSGVEHAERTQAEGVSDSIVWLSSAAASLGSGLVVAWVGFGALGLLGLALLAAGLAAIAHLRSRVSPLPAPS